MRITSVDAVALRLPAPETAANDPSQEVTLLRVGTDTGHTGVGECNHDAGAVTALVAAAGSSSIGLGLAPLLLGEDPANHERLVARMYRGNSLSARRGLGLAVIHALETCLVDLAAQARDLPLWAYLHGDAARPPRPYATLYTGPGTLAQSRDRLTRMAAAAVAAGYTAVKVEPLPECVPEAEVPGFVRLARSVVGPQVLLLVDVGHRYAGAAEALRALEAMAPADPYLLETPLWVDDVAGYRELCARSTVPIAASELFESEHEFAAMLDAGALQVVQPWPNRVGPGGTLRVAAAARERGARVVLAGWNTTGAGIALGVHLAAGLDGDVVLEHAPDELYAMPLRSSAGFAPRLVDGRFELPTTPGLGVQLSPADVGRHRAGAGSRPPTTTGAP